MKEHTKARFKSRVEQAIENETVFTTPQGDRTLDQVLMGGVKAKAISSRLFDIFTAPFVGRISHLENETETLFESKKAVGAENAAHKRKLAQRRDILVWEDLSIADLMEIKLLRDEGLSPTKIANLFELPIGRIKDVLKAADGKSRKHVLFDPAARQERRLSTVTKPTFTGTRLIDTELEPQDVEPVEKLVLHNSHKSSLS